MTEPDDVVVSYSVKDLFERLERTTAHRFDTLEKLLVGKADRADVERIERVVKDHEVRIVAVELTGRNLEAVTVDRLSRREQFWAVAGIFALCLCTLVGGALALFSH